VFVQVDKLTEGSKEIEFITAWKGVKTTDRMIDKGIVSEIF